MNVKEFLANNIRKYSQKITPLITWVERSDGMIIPIDRGMMTDTYTTKLSYRAREEELYEVKEWLFSNLEFIMEPTPEAIFADHILDFQPLKVAVLKVGSIKNKELGVATLDIELGLQDLRFIGGNGLPDLNCLQSSYERIYDNNYKVNMSYTNRYSIHDRVLRLTTFKGKYILSKEDNRALHAKWLLDLRGKAFWINDGVFGLPNMFGDGTGQHHVIINDIKYKPIGPLLRSVEINMTKLN